MSEDLRMYDNAIEAMEAGDNEKARELLSQVVEAEEENVDAWIALSKVVDNDDEKRICLTTILQLDPSNSYARRELAKSEEKFEQSKQDEEVAPGITRRMVRMATIGGTIYVLIVFIVTFLIVSTITGGKNAERAELTKIASDLDATAGAIETGNAAIAMTQTMESITATAQAQALITPSATASRTPDPRFATWTPTATESVAEFRVLELPPADVPGIIVGWGRRDSTNTGYVDPLRMPANGAEPSTEIINELARGVTIDVPGETVLFERFNRRIGEATIVILDPADPENSLTGFPGLWSSANAVDVRNPSLSADGSKFVVDAMFTDNNTREVFLIDINANQITQLTNDGANYTTPEISPDGTRVLAVRTDEANGTDLVLIDVASLNQILMTDDGNTLIESQPSWHRDGLQAVYKAHPQGQDNNSEIYLLRVLVESGSSVLLIATDADESHPIFDPNGRYVAFASNRGSGVYNIFIFDLTSVTTYQLTEDEFDVFPGGWALS